jgi:hypothetical protein
MADKRATGGVAIVKGLVAAERSQQSPDNISCTFNASQMVGQVQNNLLASMTETPVAGSPR